MLKFKAFLISFWAISALANLATGQVYDPVKWTFDVVETSPTEAELRFTATIEEGWHIYATKLPSDEGPLPTVFDIKPNSSFRIIGEISEGKPIVAFDPNFEMELSYFENVAVFRQKIERLSSDNFKVKGELSFMACDEEKCLPPDYVEFNIAVKGAKIAEEKTVDEKPSGAFQSALDQPIGLGEENQIFDPVDWKFYIENETDTSALLVAEANIDEGWHLYAMDIDPEMGPVPTSFSYEENKRIQLIGSTEQGKAKVAFDPNFEMDLGYFEGKARFTQKVRKLSEEPTTIAGAVRFMVCDTVRCLPPEDVEFSYTLKSGIAGTKAIEQDSIGGDEEEGRSNWGIFIISFLSGFAALLTPCVFPMIPMTVSFFTKQSKTRGAGIRNAVLYGMSIIGIYLLLGVVVTWIFGASVLSEMSTDPWFNLFFFVLLIVFAVSFLGAFEITLPSSWINKADKQADRGGLIGIFFMAFVLALVSFSCTGPIVGTLIVEAASRGGLAPVIGMFGFSLAIALPFALFAAFPGWLNSLPQSGGWLNSVKVVLGFLELALAFKFLSNADMVLQLHLLEREVFLAIWIVIFGLLTIYLLGKLRLSHDSEIKNLSVTRLMLAILTGTFTIYMIPGLWGAPLKIISAFPPPLQYSESPQGVGFIGGNTASASPDAPDQYLGPQGIYVFKDYEKGMAYAKKTNKPLMLDFTGHACVNCRKMEQQVWSDPEIKRMLSEEVVLVSLYVDEDVKLPESEQKTVELTGGRKKKIKTVGNKWAAFQELEYGINAQPYYVLLDLDGEKLIEAANYQDYGEIDLFKDWLERGISKFEK